MDLAPRQAADDILQVLLHFLQLKITPTKTLLLSNKQLQQRSNGDIEVGPSGE